jgi:hypothetical protein
LREEHFKKHTTKPVKHPESTLDQHEVTSYSYDSAEFITRSSTLSRLRRIVAYCLRFAHNARNPSSRRTGYLTSTELRDALHACLKIAQQEMYTLENNDLHKKGHGANCNLSTHSLTRKIIFELVEDYSIHIFHMILNMN